MGYWSSRILERLTFLKMVGLSSSFFGNMVSKCSAISSSFFPTSNYFVRDNHRINDIEISVEGICVVSMTLLHEGFTPIIVTWVLMLVI